MSEDLMVLQLDPLDHHFDPEGQAPTLWASTSWSTGSEGRPISALRRSAPDSQSSPPLRDGFKIDHTGSSRL